MSFLGILSADLRLLSLEARKKAPEVKEASTIKLEKTIFLLVFLILRPLGGGKGNLEAA